MVGLSISIVCKKKVFYCFRKVNWLLAFLFDWKVGRLFYRMQMICICSTIYTLLIKFLFEDFISGKFNLENEKFLWSIHTNSMRYWKFRCSAHLVKNTRASYFILPWHFCYWIEGDLSLLENISKVWATRWPCHQFA